MLLRAVLFDLDGTLIVHKLRLGEARLRFLQRLESIGLRHDSFRPDTPLAYILNHIKEDERDVVFGILDEVFETYELEVVDEVELRENVKEVLAFLRGLGLKMAIVTNNGKKSVKMILEKTSIGEFFHAVVTRNDVRDLKPNSSMIEEALNRLGVSPHEAVHVGDTTHDILAARQARVKCIAVAGGAHSRETLISSGPDFIIDSFSEIPRIIVGMMRE